MFIRLKLKCKRSTVYQCVWWRGQWRLQIIWSFVTESRRNTRLIFDNLPLLFSFLILGERFRIQLSKLNLSSWSWIYTIRFISTAHLSSRWLSGHLSIEHSMFCFTLPIGVCIWKAGLPICWFLQVMFSAVGQRPFCPQRCTVFSFLTKNKQTPSLSFLCRYC